MALILLLESSGEKCSVGLAKDGKLIGLKEITQPNQHASQLQILVQEVLNQHKLGMEHLNAIAVSKGPGSYTGLRVGVSAAKGYCFGLDIPLIGISTLEALTFSAIASDYQADSLYLPMIDARRMEVFCQLRTANNEAIHEAAPLILEESSFSGYEQPILCFGSGARKFVTQFSKSGIRLLPQIDLSAGNLALLAENRYQVGDFENLAYFEPFYLKDFYSTQKILA
ncbi:tRNA (adenosine(37)-N6)-threonylcarbamoyltransferase complex dimerization subunit type 1 TsaB [Bacteroidota bacterium]